MLKLVFYYYSSTINTPPLPIFLPLSKTLLQQWKRKTCGFPFKDWNLRHRKIKGHQKSIQRLPIKQLSFFLKSGQWEWSCSEILALKSLGKDVQKKHGIAKGWPQVSWMQSVRPSFSLEVILSLSPGLRWTFKNKRKSNSSEIDFLYEIFYY